MGNAEKMGLLIGLLRPNVNGAVVESMEELGIRYPRNWGVGLPAVRKAAGAFAPDHDLARFLYVQELRELRLSAFVIADPSAVTAEELDFWGNGAINTELVENLAFSLLSRTALATALVDKWLCADKPILLQYAALLALARMVDSGNCDLSMQEMAECAEHYLESVDPLIRRAASDLIGKLTLM